MPSDFIPLGEPGIVSRVIARRMQRCEIDQKGRRLAGPPGLLWADIHEAEPYIFFACLLSNRMIRKLWNLTLTTDRTILKSCSPGKWSKSQMTTWVRHDIAYAVFRVSHSDYGNDTYNGLVALMPCLLRTALDSQLFHAAFAFEHASSMNNLTMPRLARANIISIANGQLP
jgi:hypothetical protein